MNRTGTCIDCHKPSVFRRFKDTGSVCDDCRKIRSRNYYLANQKKILKQMKDIYEEKRESILIQRASYRKNNREKHNKCSADWYWKNRDSVLANKKLYYIDNKGRILMQKQKDSAKKRSRLRECEGFWTEELWLHVRSICNEECANPNCEGNSFVLTPDHITPIVWHEKFGREDATNWIINIQPLCKHCNSRKHARHNKNYLTSSQRRSIMRVFKSWLLRIIDEPLMKKERKEVLRMIRKTHGKSYTKLMEAK